MKHKKKFNHLTRTSEHRHAMLSNMAASLILHKRIRTTVAKAKALRIYVEPLLTKSKKGDMNAHRIIFSYIKQKGAMKELFTVVAPKIEDRPGGYTRILRVGNRPGDNAEMCIIELVDFNTTYTEVKSVEAKKPRTRRSSKKSGDAPKGEATAAKQAKEEAPEAAVESAPEGADAAEAVVEATAEAEAEAEVEATAETPAEEPVAEPVAEEAAPAEVAEAPAEEAAPAEEPAKAEKATKPAKAEKAEEAAPAEEPVAEKPKKSSKKSAEEPAEEK